MPVGSLSDDVLRDGPVVTSGIKDSDDDRPHVYFADYSKNKKSCVMLGNCVLAVNEDRKDLSLGYVFRFPDGQELAIRKRSEFWGGPTLEALWNGKQVPGSAMHKDRIQDGYKVAADFLVWWNLAVALTVLLLEPLMKSPLPGGRYFAVPLVMIGLLSWGLKRRQKRDRLWLAACIIMGIGFVSISLVFWWHVPNPLLIFFVLCMWRQALDSPYTAFRIALERAYLSRTGKSAVYSLRRWKRAKAIDVPRLWGRCAFCGVELTVDEFPEGTKCPKCWTTRRGPICHSSSVADADHLCSEIGMPVDARG